MYTCMYVLCTSTKIILNTSDKAFYSGFIKNMQKHSPQGYFLDSQETGNACYRKT